MTTARPTTAWGRWTHFWFAPADPTTMAFVRVVTGVLVLYTHLAYSFDLYAFFGEHGWYGLTEINRERREMPWTPPPFWDGWKWWDQSARLPEEPHRREALLAYLRGLPTDRPTLDRKLAALAVEGVEPDGEGYPSWVGPLVARFANGLSPDPAVRANTLKAMAKDPAVPRNANEQFPFDGLVDPTHTDNPNWRLERLARDLEAFHSTLPPVPDKRPTETEADYKRTNLSKLEARRYIALYFAESDWIARYNFLKFARDLAGWPSAEARDAATEAERERAAAARAKKLDYFRYWNIERRYTDRVGNPIFSIWFHIHTPTEMAVAHGVMLVVMLMFTLGLFTRVTAVLTWLCCVSYIHRNQQVLFGQDTMMNILLVYLMVANCGQALSLDRLIARYRAAKASLRRGGTIDAATARYLDAPPLSVTTGFAQRLLQVHFCFIYMAAGLSKLKGGSWWSTNAMWDTIANPEFTLVFYQWYQEVLRALIEQRILYAASAAAVVGFTLFVEISLPFLVWTKLRPYIIVAGMLMHFGIGVFMGLLIFSLLMMTMLASYLPGPVIRRQLFGNPPAEKTRLAVDPANEAEVRKVAWAVARDSVGRFEVVRR